MDEGFIPIQSEVAKAIEKTPQSLPPTCICAAWKCKVIFLLGVLLQQFVPLLSLVDQ